MFKKIRSLVLCSIFFFMCACLPVFESKASIPEFYMDYAEPAKSPSQGYVTFLLEDNATQTRVVETFFWSCYAIKDGAQAPAEMQVTVATWGANFNINQYGASGGWYTLYRISSEGVYDLLQNSSSSDITYRFSDNNYTVKGWMSGGNAYVKGFDNTIPFFVYYSTDGSAIYLSTIMGLLMESNRITNGMYEELTELLNSEINDVEEQLDLLLEWASANSDKLTDIQDKLDDLITEQQESNSWLEKIFNYLNESQEQQKQEAEIQGGNSTSQGMDAIEDKGAGFTDSLGGLVSSMSYNGTECAWNFPEVKLPAISGVMDEIVLMESQPIDFAQWVNAIPNDILIVVQSLLTIGLIVYCFKELYSTIAYVLTLRKDDNA